MRKPTPIAIAIAFAGFLSAGALVRALNAADAKEESIKDVMNACHRAPKGVDPICKKAVDGKAAPDELKKLVAAYKFLASAKPPKGDEASWKDKTGKLLAAALALEKGAPAAAAKYKEALNCKACHSVHRPD